MRKKEVEKELNRLGFDVKITDGPLTPDLPEGLMAIDNMKLRLTPAKEEELRIQQELRRESPEPLGTAKPVTHIQTIADMIRQHPPKKYSVEDVISFITTYVVEGSYIAVERAHGIPYQTLQDWHANRPWFNEVVNYIKNTTDHELEAQMTKIVRLATDKLIDRMENGDTGVHQGSVVYVEDEDGNEVESKIPLSSDQLARIGAIWFDKRQIARGMDIHSQGNKTQTIEDKLAAVAERMQSIAEQMPGPNIINVTPETK